MPKKTNKSHTDLVMTLRLILFRYKLGEDKTSNMFIVEASNDGSNKNNSFVRSYLNS